jgi:hypothetical protein
MGRWNFSRAPAHRAGPDRFLRNRQAERCLEAAEAAFGDVADTLDKALSLLADCQRAYVAAPGHLRRQWNQALFERLVVYDERIAELRSRSPSQRSPIPRFLIGWMVRPSLAPTLFWRRFK